VLEALLQATRRSSIPTYLLHKASKPVGYRYLRLRTYAAKKEDIIRRT
jgi:hypothetical protein